MQSNTSLSSQQQPLHSRNYIPRPTFRDLLLRLCVSLAKLLGSTYVVGFFFFSNFSSQIFQQGSDRLRAALALQSYFALATITLAGVLYSVSDLCLEYVFYRLLDQGIFLQVRSSRTADRWPHFIVAFSAVETAVMVAVAAYLTNGSFKSVFLVLTQMVHVVLVLRARACGSEPVHSVHDLFSMGTDCCQHCTTVVTFQEAESNVLALLADSSKNLNVLSKIFECKWGGGKRGVVSIADVVCNAGGAHVVPTAWWRKAIRKMFGQWPFWMFKQTLFAYADAQDRTFHFLILAVAWAAFFVAESVLLFIVLASVRLVDVDNGWY